MDLELVLHEFLGGFGTEVKSTSPAKNMVEVTLYIRKFVQKYPPQIDLLTQYKHAVSTDQFELASTIREEVLKIINE